MRAGPLAATADITPAPTRLSRLAALCRQVAELADAAVWNLNLDALDLADDLERLADTARTVADRID